MFAYVKLFTSPTSGSQTRLHGRSLLLVRNGVADKLPPELLGTTLVIAALAIVFTAVPHIIAEAKAKEAEQERPKASSSIQWADDPRAAIPDSDDVHRGPHAPPPAATGDRPSEFSFVEMTGTAGATPGSEASSVRIPVMDNPMRALVS